jgi:fucose permease
VSAPATTRARDAVYVVFGFNGFLFASLASRFPDVRSGLGLDNGGLGLLLLVIAVGSLVALPSAGRLIERFDAATVVRGGVVAGVSGAVLAAVGAGALGSVPVTGAGFLVYGMGIGVWDVAMNVEGAEVERRLGRTIMPRFHAAFSLGTIAGAGLGVPATAVDLPVLAHLGVVGALALVLTTRWAGAFLEPHPDPEQPEGRGRSAWLEPRTLAVGVMVLAFAVVEGSANDWLTLALIDGYGVDHWVGVTGYATFLTAMTLGRLAGTVLLDRFGRAPVLWSTSALAAVGILLVVLGDHVALVGLGVLLWGLGASLGFPVGMSAAADDPARAAARVSVVSTIGYAAFLGGPPLLGLLGDRVGTLDALLVVAALMVPAAVSVLAARPSRRTPQPAA